MISMKDSQARNVVGVSHRQEQGELRKGELGQPRVEMTFEEILQLSSGKARPSAVGL